MRTHITRGGFSVIEMLVVMAILGVIFGLSVAAFSHYSRYEVLASNAAALAGGIRDARAQTLASVGASQYGVKVDADRFTFFKGSSFSSSTPGNETFVFSSYLRASSSISTFVFERVTGNATASGTIDLYLISDPTTAKTVSVQRTGLVSVQ